MKCEEIQERLSEYHEGLLDRDTAGIVRKHLAACTRCREELRALAETRRAVSDLPSVNPPPGFAQRVMSRVREEADRPSLFHRLFLPIHIKIPIHALALLLVGGMAVYLYQSHPPLPPVETGPTSPEPKSTAGQGRTAPIAAPPAKKESFSPPAEEKLEKETLDKAGRVRSKSGKLKETAGGIMAGAIPKLTVPEYELTIAVRPDISDLKKLAARFEGRAGQMGGHYIPSGKSAEGAEKDVLNRSETIRLFIPEKQYGRLKTELSTIGKIEDEIRISPATPASPEAGSSTRTSPYLTIKLTFQPTGSP